MRAKEKVGISTMVIVIVLAAIIIIAAVAAAGWWFFIRPVGKKTSAIDLSLHPEVPNGENQIISGLIDPAVADVTVTLTFTMPDNSTFTRTVTSSANGSFTYTFKVEMEGNWTVTASWPGNNEFKEATSIIKTFMVVEALVSGTSRISCFILPNEVERGESVTVSGQIWTSPTGAGAGVTVTLDFTRPDNSTFAATVTSASDGSFTYTYSSVGGDLVGWWDVTASWAGTAEVAGDVSYVAVFHLIPVLDTAHPIKFGVIGPMDWIQGIGMREAAILAADQINEEGGILGRKVVIKTGDEGMAPERGTAEMERLCDVEDVHFLLGGFRTEIVDPMREVAMDYRIPFSICGAATPWLIDCITTSATPGHNYPCGHCVRCDYERYKYLFRVTPTNTDVLFGNFVVPYIRDYLIPSVLIPALNVTPIKVGVIIENLAWTSELRAKMDVVGPFFFGIIQSQIVCKYYVSPLTKDFSPILADMKEKGAHLIFEVFSGEEGLAFIKQWRDLDVKAVPVGINVLSQESEMWTQTGGRCEYEAFLATMGTKTPLVPDVTVKFWDDYTTRWGHAPIYTSFGAYDSIMGTKEIVEKAALDHPEYELDNPDVWEEKYNDRTLYDIIIPYMEAMDRQGILGRARFTTTHDIFTPGWNVTVQTRDYVKPLVVQWRSPGRMAAISAGKGSESAPAWAPYIEPFQIPPWMLE